MNKLGKLGCAILTVGVVAVMTLGSQGSSYASTTVRSTSNKVFEGPIAVSSSGKAYVCAIATNHSMPCYSATPGSAWTKIGGANLTAKVAYSTPQVAIQPDGEVDVVTNGCNPQNCATGWNYFSLKSGATQFTRKSMPVVDCTSAPCTGDDPQIAVRSSGEIDVVVYNGNLEYYSLPSGGSTFSMNLLPSPSFGQLNGGPSMVVRSSGEVDIAIPVLDESDPTHDFLAYYHSTAPTTSSWTINALGTPTTGPDFGGGTPSLAVRTVDPAGEADIVDPDSSGNLYFYHAIPGGAWSDDLVGSNSAFANGCPEITVRSANAEGEADIVIAGPTGSLDYFHATPGNPWLEHTVAGSNAIDGTPSIAVRSSGEADIFVTGPGGSLLYYHATPGNPWDKDVIAGSGFIPFACAY
jgi:hypothetical protein